jgi:hypothetical protein
VSFALFVSNCINVNCYRFFYKGKALGLITEQNQGGFERPYLSDHLGKKIQMESGNTKKGKYHCTIELLFDWFGLVCFANKNKNCQLSYSLFQTSQTGGQWYSDTSPFRIPCRNDPSLVASPKGQSYKSFYGSNLRIFVIS